VLRLVSGDFGFVDSARTRMKGSRKLVAEMTLRDGKVVWDLNGLTGEDWDAAASRSRGGNARK
jgi:dihydroorotase